jgi:hypothetical protein
MVGRWSGRSLSRHPSLASATSSSPFSLGLLRSCYSLFWQLFNSIANALNAWLILIALFAGLAGTGVLVAMSHYQNGIAKEIYTTELANFIKICKRFLRRDATEAAVAAVIAALGATLRISQAITLPMLTFPLLITGILILGLCGHELTARMWKTVLSRAAIQEKPQSEQTSGPSDRAVDDTQSRSRMAQSE